MPSASTLRHMVREAREHSVKKFATVLDNGSPFAMAFDQGERAGLGRLIKEMSWFDFDSDCVIDIRLDSDASRKTDTDVAGALHSSLKQVDKYRNEEKISKASGQCSDSGGGGTIESVTEALRLVDRVDNFVYHVSACCLHAQSKALQNSVEFNYGEGGLGNNNFLQLLHTCWSLQEALGEDFKSEWKIANPGRGSAHIIDMHNETWDQQQGQVESFVEGSISDDDIGRLQKPLLTRWWHVNVAAYQVCDSFDAWQSFFRHCFDTTTSTDRQKMHTISKNGCCMLKSAKIQCDLLFFCSFSQ
eukprot:scaffold473164_cov149-Attheya_sp.AAC.1